MSEHIKEHQTPMDYRKLLGVNVSAQTVTAETAKTESKDTVFVPKAIIPDSEWLSPHNDALFMRIF